MLPLAPTSIDRLYRSIFTRITMANTPLQPVPAAGGCTSIRVGYLSNQYRRHPGMILASGLVGAHARAEFEVFGYAFNAGDDEFQQRAEARLDPMLDVSRCTDAEIAERIRADGVDIVIDLNGYSDNGRPGIVARRSSPIQVQYLGHMHSMFADWIDYRVTDAASEPDASDLGLQEGRAFLPPSVFPYDDALWGDPPCPHRRAAGLPDAAFVRCAVQQVIKIMPRQFDLWLALLKGMSGRRPVAARLWWQSRRRPHGVCQRSQEPRAQARVRADSAPRRAPRAAAAGRSVSGCISIQCAHDESRRPPCPRSDFNAQR